MKDPFRTPGKQEAAAAAPIPRGIGPWPYGEHYNMSHIDGSFIMEWTIEPQQVAVFTSDDCAKKQCEAKFNYPWQEGDAFFPSHLIYVGDADLWLLHAHVQKASCFGSGPLPMDSYRPGSHHIINWPVFSPFQHLEFTVENRSRDHTRHFALRLGGKYNRPRPMLPSYPRDQP